MVIKQLCNNHKEKWGQLESALVSFGFSHDVQQFVMAVGDDDDYDTAAAANGDHNNGDIDSLNAARRINSTNDNYIQQYLLIVSPLLLLLVDVTFLVVELELNRSKSSS